MIDVATQTYAYELLLPLEPAVMCEKKLKEAENIISPTPAGSELVEVGQEVLKIIPLKSKYCNWIAFKHNARLKYVAILIPCGTQKLDENNNYWLL